MPDSRRVTCQHCGKPSREVGPISWRGRCIPCAKLRSDYAIEAMKAHEGPMFEYWRRRTAASVGATLLDDTRASA